MDVKNAFLQGDLEVQVFMVHLPGFQSELNKLVVHGLRKSLYILKQAPRAWNAKITQKLHQTGSQPLKSDLSLFIRKGWNGPVNILLCVDDFVIIGPDLEEIRRVKSQLVGSFQMKDLGDLQYFHEIEVICTHEGILIFQRHTMLNMFFDFGMTCRKTLVIPLARNVKLHHESRWACDETRF